MPIYISRVRSALQTLACARIDTNRLNQKKALLIVLGTTALPMAGCGSGGGSGEEANDSANEPANISSTKGPSSLPIEEAVNSPVEEVNNPPVINSPVSNPPVEEVDNPPAEEVTYPPIINPPVEEVNDSPVEEVNDPPVEEVDDSPVEEVNDPPVEEVDDSPVEEAYVDDTYEVLQSGININAVSGPFGYDDYKFNESTNGEQLALDARNASFIVANSKNPDPTDDFDCDMGSNPTNLYPLKVYDADNISVVGGIINGEIPQESDWSPTYCNSGAVIFKRADNPTVDGIRITSAWDGIRPSDNSKGLTIKNSWLSNVRDDAVENDEFLPLVFEDNLVDGAFQGISVKSGGDITTQSEETIYVYGNVIRIREYLYKGRQQFGALFKNEDSSPSSVVNNTVVAVDYNGGYTWRNYWEKSWSKIEQCSNNLFLWLSDQPIPSSVPLPPACFEVLTGSEAQDAWDAAQQNWIDCHPNVARTPNDPASNPEQCVANTFGGYSR